MQRDVLEADGSLWPVENTYLKLLVGYSLSSRTVPSALVSELFYPSLAKGIS